MSVSFEYSMNNGFFDRVIAKAQEKVNKAVDDAFTELFKEMKSDLEKLYDKVVTQFYNDYVPVLYDRNYSLYDILHMSENEDEVKWGFDSAKMTPFRSGGGHEEMMELVFAGGWHGGADNGDYTVVYSDDSLDGYSIRYTPHPSPGTPYWRQPIPFYTQWGRQAAHSTPPLKVWEEQKDEYVRTKGREKMRSLVRDHIAKIKWF